jgi:hypothetical protein
LDPFDLQCIGTDPNIGKPSGTSETANNSYTDQKQGKVAPEGKRIDHVLFQVSPLWQVSFMRLIKYTHTYIHTYHRRLTPEGRPETSQAFF